MTKTPRAFFETLNQDLAFSEHWYLEMGLPPFLVVPTTEIEILPLEDEET
jgi:hypothetical protein